jgi:hypothetical protein
MTGTTSQASSSSVDLYDQDRYSIPDDELSSDGSSVISSEEDNAADTMDIDATQASSRKTTVIAKRHKLTKSPLKKIFDPHLHGMELLHGQSMADVKQACEQLVDEASSDTTSSSYRRRVPLTTFTSVEDDHFGDPFPKNINDVMTVSTFNAEKLTSRRPRHTSSLKQATTSSRNVDIAKKSTHTKPTPKFDQPTVGGTTPEIMSSVPPQLTNPVLPSFTTSRELTSTTFFTYRAQLTFGLPTPSDGVNVAKYFRRWIYSSSESIDHFALVPYEDEKGIQISSLDQVPDDNSDFYSIYYHNHRVLNHGNLTGMVQFQCSTPWARLKSPNHPFFNWLHLNKVYLNQTKFKTSSLVPCGFLLGAHPGHMRRDEAESELGLSLGFPSSDELPFQLSS